MVEDDWLERGQYLDVDETAEGDLTERPEKGRKKPAREKAPRAASGGLAAIIGTLSPWQRFVLALLLFLNVALLGCMCLVMAGRVVPFSP